jgi:hypothetical protein
LPRQLHASGKSWLLLVGVAVVAGVAIATVQPRSPWMSSTMRS